MLRVIKHVIELLIKKKFDINRYNIKYIIY